MDKRLALLIDRLTQIWDVSADEAVKLISIGKNKALRINTLKGEPKETLKQVEGLDINLKPITWAANSYFIDGDTKILTRHPLFSEGYFILQNSSSLAAVICLDPTENDHILDICAAPGAKTSHIAALSHNMASITANDASKNRFFKLKRLLDLMNVKAEVTLFDGRNLKRELEDKSFNKILLDAPCSGEASIDVSNPKSYQTWSTAKVKRLSKLQKGLIMTTYKLLSPGGILVYSTCTVAPEENEVVIDYLLRKTNAELVEPNIELPSVRPGLTLWKDRKLSPDLSNCARIMPSAINEAFFIAKLTKPVDSDSE